MQQIKTSASSVRKIWWGSGSAPCWRALIVLREKGLEFKDILISFDNKEHKGEELMKLNPRGEVPIFVDDNGVVVNESLAICDYLESVYKDQGTKLIPEDRDQLALHLHRKYEIISNLEKKMHEFVIYMYSTKEDDRDKDVLEKKKNAATEELKLWEERLEKQNAANNYSMGKGFSMVDVILVPMFGMSFRFGLSEEKYPAIKKYYNRALKRESVRLSVPPHWASSDPTIVFAQDL